MLTTKNNLDRSKLMAVLWSVQRKKRHISRDDITKIAKEFNLSRMEVEGVVTFYHFFHKTDCGKYTIYLNNSITSQHAGMNEIKKAFEEAIGVPINHVSYDKMFGLFETACIGLSDQEPACLINFKPFTNLTPEKVHNIVSKLKNGEKPKDICDKPKSNIRYTPSVNKTLFFKPYNIFSSLKHLKKHTPNEIIDLITKSKLAGRGGAFFPTGLKWKFARQNNADIKYLFCNADEGEPGTFKDRVLIQEKPEMLIEGMIIAAYAIGARQGAIYLRAEYYYLKDKLENILEEYRKNGFLGKNIPAIKNFEFDIYIHMGAGAYICGEETAMIRSMEGRRGEPGTKEYFPVEKGYKGKPTVVNNVETLCAVSGILNMGIDKWLSYGTKKTPGSKIFSVSGDCKYPGIYEIEWGMKVKDFLNLIGANDPYYILFNGYAGKCLSKLDFDRELSGEGVLAANVKINTKNKLEYQQRMTGIGVRSGGAFMVFNSQRNIVQMIDNVTDFFVQESCGICVPCRVGNFLLKRKLDKVLNGKGNTKDIKEVREWCKVIETNSRCGLGIMSTSALIDTLDKYPEVFEKLINNNNGNNTSFSLEKATQEYDHIIKEITANYE
ncbi:NAD(P)H-dependent oxidoreductase subunit E [Lutibacter sp.]